MAEPQVVIGRLNKKNAKLQQQRDFWRQRCEHYAKVIEMHPYMERDYKSVMERRKERERVKGLEQRVAEQALLIEKLTAGEAQP